MVKNFLVVVTMEQVRGPKEVTVMKMNIWESKIWSYLKHLRTLNKIGSFSIYH